MVAVASPLKTTAQAKSARPVGTLIDQLWKLREDRRKHEAEIEALNKGGRGSAGQPAWEIER